MGVLAYASPPRVGDPDQGAAPAGAIRYQPVGDGKDERKGRTIPAITARRPSAADVLSVVTSSLADDKAEDITLIDLAGKTSIADIMVIASGTSSRHVGAMAEHIAHKLKLSGLPSVAVEGAGVCDWVLIDAGDVLVHLFRPEVRRFYALERLWDAPAAVRADAAVG